MKKLIKIKKALISISDKENLKPVLQLLKRYKIQIISSGGTYKEIKKLKFKCTEVSRYTGSPEILGGRVKTLHPKIYSGILSKRNNKSHIKDLKNNNFEEIDLVIVNFYPFEKILLNSSNNTEIIENIDIGGPSMVRAAAKNYNDVVVVTSKNQYLELINELQLNKGSSSISFRKKLSEEAFSETAYYDAVIASYFNKINKNYFPKKKIIYSNLIEKLRYGENPHQESAIYTKNNNLNIVQLHGKKLSYNNYNDIFSALSVSKSLPKNVGTVIVKHSNPCGVSAENNHLKSFQMALKCDPISAFGGIVSCNYKLSSQMAMELNKIFLEVVVANGFEKSALKILKNKKNLRIIDSSKLNFQNTDQFTSTFDAILSQSKDTNQFTPDNFKVVSKRKPTKEEFKNLIFAFNICRFVKSNAIVITHNKSTLGIGSGQPSRLDSCKLAIDKMKVFQNLKNKKILAASDAFFPFVDGIEKLIQAGVTGIVQPSGSIRDREIIKFADKTKTVLLFSKTRHFKH